MYVHVSQLKEVNNDLTLLRFLVPKTRCLQNCASLRSLFILCTAAVLIIINLIIHPDGGTYASE